MKQKKLLGIIGHPVAHSLSPLMHNRAAELIGLDCVYCAFDVAPQNLKEALAGMRSLGVEGLNVTVPHKEKVIPFLDRLDEEAALIGAVNTITLKNGKLIGSNTDAKGFIRSVKQKGFRPRGKSAVIIGAGGSARAIGVALCRAGLSKLTIINRSAQRGRHLVRTLSKLGDVSFAARSGGKKEKWAGTSKKSELGSYAWYRDNSGKKAHPVGGKKPNGLGLYDMSGNVREWVADLYDKDYYRNSPTDDPTGSGSGDSRLLRGGSWGKGEGRARVSNRIWFRPNDRQKYGGFRCSQ